MVSKKGKRKLVYEGRAFYWFVRPNSAGIPKIHIMSEDKKIRLEDSLFDSEVPVVPSYIRRLLTEYFEM